MKHRVPRKIKKEAKQFAARKMCGCDIKPNRMRVYVFAESPKLWVVDRVWTDRLERIRRTDRSPIIITPTGVVKGME